MTAAPYTSKAWNVFRPAWMPAPPLGSDPATVRATGVVGPAPEGALRSAAMQLEVYQTDAEAYEAAAALVAERLAAAARGGRAAIALPEAAAVFHYAAWPPAGVPWARVASSSRRVGLPDVDARRTVRLRAEPARAARRAWRARAPSPSAANPATVPPPTATVARSQRWMWSVVELVPRAAGVGVAAPPRQRTETWWRFPGLHRRRARRARDAHDRRPTLRHTSSSPPPQRRASPLRRLREPSPPSGARTGVLRRPPPPFRRPPPPRALFATRPSPTRTQLVGLYRLRTAVDALVSLRRCGQLEESRRLIEYSRHGGRRARESGASVTNTSRGGPEGRRHASRGSKVSSPSVLRTDSFSSADIAGGEADRRSDVHALLGPRSAPARRTPERRDVACSSAVTTTGPAPAPTRDR